MLLPLPSHYPKEIKINNIIKNKSWEQLKTLFQKNIQLRRTAGIVEKSEYDQALSQYNLNITDEEVKAAVTKIIAEKVSENDNLEVKKFLLGSVELTTLSTTDTEEKVTRNGRESEPFRQ